MVDQLNSGKEFFLSEALAYDRQVISEPIDLPEPSTTSVYASVRKRTVQSQMLETLLSVTDYPELRDVELHFFKNIFS